MLPNKEMLEAIATRVCVTATYNRDTIVLAPHVLYTRHGEEHADGVVLERNGAPPKEAKLSTFKLAGLHDVAVTDRAFVSDPLFDPKGARMRG
jgi:hypothetical protein